MLRLVKQRGEAEAEASEREDERHSILRARRERRSAPIPRAPRVPAFAEPQSPPPPVEAEPATEEEIEAWAQRPTVIIPPSRRPTTRPTAPPDSRR